MRLTTERLEMLRDFADAELNRDGYLILKEQTKYGEIAKEWVTEIDSTLSSDQLMATPDLTAMREKEFVDHLCRFYAEFEPIAHMGLGPGCDMRSLYYLLSGHDVGLTPIRVHNEMHERAAALPAAPEPVSPVLVAAAQNAVNVIPNLILLRAHSTETGFEMTFDQDAINAIVSVRDSLRAALAAIKSTEPSADPVDQLISVIHGWLFENPRNLEIMRRLVPTARERYNEWSPDEDRILLELQKRLDAIIVGEPAAEGT